MVRSLSSSKPTTFLALALLASAFLALALVASACNAFDDPPLDRGGDISPPTTGGFGGIGGGGAVSTPPSAGRPPNEFPPGSGPDMPSCMQCGTFCSDCGDGKGCQCSEGHTPFEPAAWKVPFSNPGDDGWRSSASALCPAMDKIVSSHVWGNGRGVYALVAGMSSSPDALGAPDDDAGVASTPDASAFAPRTRVFHNQGTGWALRADLSGASMQGALSGIERTLFVYGGPGEDRRACSLGVVSGNQFDCKLVDTTVASLVVVSPTLAYALDGVSKLRVYDGTRWRLHPQTLPRSASALWADQDEVVAVGPEGIVQRLRGDKWTVENVGGIPKLTAVWGTSGSDLWVGTFTGSLLHFDGKAWGEVTQLGGVTCGQRLPIEHVWGIGSHVWVHTASQLARWDGSALTTFGNWTCSSLMELDRINNVWGTAEDDVFIAVSGSGTQGPCGPAFMVHYDGELFHRF